MVLLVKTRTTGPSSSLGWGSHEDWHSPISILPGGNFSGNSGFPLLAEISFQHILDGSGALLGIIYRLLLSTWCIPACLCYLYTCVCDAVYLCMWCIPVHVMHTCVCDAYLCMWCIPVYVMYTCICDVYLCMLCIYSVYLFVWCLPVYLVYTCLWVYACNKSALNVSVHITVLHCKEGS